LNPYRDYSPLDPESSASANSATSAFVSNILNSQGFVKYSNFIYSPK
jgi:hypothetical protein